MAAVARDRDRERDVARRAASRLDELELELRRDVGAARAPRPAAEEIVAEEGGEDVGQGAEVEMAGREAAAAQACVAVAVVQLAPLRVREHLIGLRDLAKALLCV